jgi:predicted pyridoxine 5'-phosphate oxidase superfamily flavin-nucleotide-binding protein
MNCWGLLSGSVDLYATPSGFHQPRRIGRRKQAMAFLPENVRQAWEDRDGPTILATVSEDGVPNVIYVTCVGVFGNDRLVVADNYFDKTRFTGVRDRCCSATRRAKRTRSRGAWSTTQKERCSIT